MWRHIGQGGGAGRRPPYGGPGAWASGTADASVSVRGSGPPHPPTTSMEGRVGSFNGSPRKFWMVG
jgi:hypothetical protein